MWCSLRSSIPFIVQALPSKPLTSSTSNPVTLACSLSKLSASACFSACSNYENQSGHQQKCFCFRQRKRLSKSNRNAASVKMHRSGVIIWLTRTLVIVRDLVVFPLANEVMSFRISVRLIFHQNSNVQ